MIELYTPLRTPSLMDPINFVWRVCVRARVCVCVCVCTCFCHEKAKKAYEETFRSWIHGVGVHAFLSRSQVHLRQLVSEERDQRSREQSQSRPVLERFLGFRV